ncbi:hypothetical protein [Phenylobacterium sp.]|jgi:hypothetical protein|uniref:hypothetical protein n=1 Tax=Phenylobacterium sp. TaxID=1871053 RepID=UPI002E2EAB5F|nr:hypothetical protein [Phenylobacterium sp.]HEX2560647.1 hypothetical protein [Phenylobacterium sp.]
MAQKKTASQAREGGNSKSSGKGGGRGASSGVSADPTGNTTAKGQRPSPDSRKRGEVSDADRA